MIKSEFKSSFEKLIRDISDFATKSKARIDLLPGNGSFDRIVKIVPANPQSAPIEVAGVGDAYVRLFLGRATEIEFNLGNPKTNESEIIISICEAVINGRFTETVWMKGEKVCGYTSKIEALDRSVLNRDFNLMSYLFLRPQKQTFNYQEY